MSDENQPCGSWRVTEWSYGHRATFKWCDRLAGPCPFPDTEQDPNRDRPCAAITEIPR